MNHNNDDCDATQAMIDMIDINTNHLNGLRTECSLIEALTQGEIRSVENKLIKLFGKQSVERQIALLNGNYNVPSPQTRKWLYIVGLNDSLIESIVKKIGDNFDKLLSLNEDQLNDLIDGEATADEKRRLVSAMSNLKLFIEKLKVKDPVINELDLHWNSWDQNLLENHHNNNDSSEFSSSNYLANDQLSDNRSSYPPSPLDESKKLIINSQEQLDFETTSKSSSSKEFKSPSTPPLLKNNQINNSNHRLPITQPSNRKYKTNHHPPHHVDNNYNLSMPKSKSHEEHLTNKIDKNNDQFDQNYRRRLESEPCTDTKLHNSFSNSRSPPITSPDNYNAQSDSCFEEQSSSSLANSITNVNAPRSPRSQGMLHSIHHLFTNRLTPRTVNCNLCEKPVMFGFKCRECKFRCHKECANKVPPSCGLPAEYFTIFKEAYNNRRSPISVSNAINQQPQQTPQHNKNKKSKFKTNFKRSSPDSSNASSRNSSAPSSPIQSNDIVNTSTVSTANTSSSNKTFNFNHIDEISTATSTRKNKKDNFPLAENANHLNEDNRQQHSVSTINENESQDQVMNRNLAIRLNSQDSQASIDYDTGDKPWPRQNSLTMREWNISFDEIKNKEKIGIGRFGTVFKGYWHGNVAIKMFNMADGLDDKNAIEAFRSEVDTFRKTRHDNLVLFMGACMKPPHLAIVTSYCKGFPLYTHLYEQKVRFNLNRIINIGRQIAQGMGYLHHRGIIHKDLRSKNIFYDNSNSKVVISDFGFFSLTKLCFSNDNKKKGMLKVPKGWLCYLAPELIKALRTGNDGQEQEDLPFSASTDVFSFGTIWHELIFGFLPFDGLPAEVVIWQVGKGVKQSLTNLQASKEIKDVLMSCWTYKPNDRPSFSRLHETLTNLPKKRLQRSPSHPTHLMTKHDID